MTDVNETKQPAAPLTMEEQIDQLREDILVRDRITAAKEQELTNAFMMISQSIAVMAAKTDVALDLIQKAGDMTQEEMAKIVTERVQATLKKQQEAMEEAAQAQLKANEASVTE